MHSFSKMHDDNFDCADTFLEICKWTLGGKYSVWSGLNQQNSFATCSRAVLPLNWLTKVAKSTIFLLSLTPVTFHNCIARKFNHIPFFMFGPKFFLSCHLLLMLFSLAGFLLRHFDWTILLEIVKNFAHVNNFVKNYRNEKL